MRRGAGAVRRKMPAGTYPVLVLESAKLTFLMGLPEAYAVSVLPSWPALYGVLSRAHPALVAVVDPYAADGRVDPEFFTLLANYPSIAIVAAFEVEAGRVGDLRRMLDEGASEVLNLCREADVGLARRRLRNALARPLKRQVEGALSAHVSADARVVIRAAIEVAAVGGKAPDLAEKLGVAPRTLIQYCANSGALPPRRLLAWMRILLAAQLLEDPGRSIGNVALACGYANDWALRRTVRKFVNPESLRGIFGQAAAAFNDDLRMMREERLIRRPSVPAKVVTPMQVSDVQATAAGEGG